MRVNKKFGIFALHYDMGFSFVLHLHLLNVPNTKTGNEKWLNLYLEKNNAHRNLNTIMSSTLRIDVLSYITIQKVAIISNQWDFNPTIILLV